MELQPLIPDHYEKIFEISEDLNLWEGNCFQDFIQVLSERHGFVIVSSQGETVGYLNFTHHDPGVDILVHLMIAPKWQGRWATKEVLKAMFGYVFKELRLNRVSSYSVVGVTDKAGEFLRRLGFTQEGCLREKVLKADGFHDVLYFGMLRKECRWI